VKSEEIKKKIMLDLHNIDCMELMAKYPDGYFDLAIVDPPYGINAGDITSYHKTKSSYSITKYNKKDWDSSIPDKRYFDLLFSISKNQIIWGGNYMVRFLKSSSSWIIWDKMQPDCVSFNKAEIAYTSFSCGNKIFRRHSAADSYRGPKNPSTFHRKRIHPTQKPIALYKWLLGNYAKPGDKILDTHLGSGSIAIACHDMGYDLTGSELDPDYFAAMQQRIAQHQSQLTLKI
jgi:site-specific DNA-methyltransferase (adenine-specific)